MSLERYVHKRMITYPKKQLFVVTMEMRRFSALSKQEDPETLYTSVRLFASFKSRKAPEFHSASPCPEKSKNSAQSHRTTCLLARKTEISAVPHRTSRRLALKTSRFSGSTSHIASSPLKNRKVQRFHIAHRVVSP